MSRAETLLDKITIMGFHSKRNRGVGEVPLRRHNLTSTVTLQGASTVTVLGAGNVTLQGGGIVTVLGAGNVTLQGEGIAPVYGE